MDRRSFLATLPLTALAACTAPYTIVRLAVGNPFAGRQRLVLEPVRYEGLLVEGEPEAAWLARRAATDATAYLRERAALADAFRREVTASGPRFAIVHGPPQSDDIVVRPFLAALVPGLYSHFQQVNAEARMTFQVFAPPQVLCDEAQAVVSVRATQYHPSARDRLELAGAELGHRCTAFLGDRAAGRR